MKATWCPECSYGITVDEDGCCDCCGATATGTGADDAANLSVENEGLRREIAALKEALEELMAWQNGPPLENYRERWTKAMDNAQRLLDAAPSGGEGE